MESLSNHDLMDSDGRYFGTSAATNRELTEKVNELVFTVNDLQRQVEYLLNQIKGE